MTRYKKTNSIVISHIEEKKYVTVEYPSDSVSEWQVQYPLLVSFDSSSLYVYHIEKNSYEEYICPINDDDDEEEIERR